MATGTALLGLIGDTHGLVELGEFRWELLRALERAIPVDWISLNDIGPEPGDVFVLAEPEPPDDLLAAYVTHADQNPLTAYYAETRDGRAIRFSDLVTREELHALDLYRTVYAPLGVEYQMAFTLPHVEDRILGIALSRREKDFSDAERDLLERARPFLIQAYRNAIRYSGLIARDGARDGGGPKLPALIALGLTPRQAEILRLIATGTAEREIAAQLAISPRTVEKHLENSYRRLGVGNRARAAALAWSTLDGGTPLPPVP